MHISGEEKSAMLIRLDNIRTLKLLQRYGYGMLNHDWNPGYGYAQHLDDNIFFSALKTIFGEENVKEFYVQYNSPSERREVKQKISEFLGCNFRLRQKDVSYSFSVIAIKHEKLNSRNSKRRILIETLNGEDVNDCYEINEFAIFLVKTGFLIMLEELWGYSTLVMNILKTLEMLGLAKKTELHMESLPDTPEIRIIIKPELANIEINTDAGLKASRQMHPATLIQALVQHSVIPDEIKPPGPSVEVTKTGILPHDHNSTCTLFINNEIEIEYETVLEGSSVNYKAKSKLSKTTMGVLVPAGRYTYNYNGELYEIPFPQMLFIFTMTDNNTKLTGCSVHAMRKGQVSVDSILYKFPLGNVGNGGNICFGYNKLPTFKDLSELSTFFRFVLALEHNDDFFTSTKGKLQREIIQELSQLDEFDESLLIEYGTIKTLLN